MKLFIRQSFTQSDEAQGHVVQEIMDLISAEYNEISFITGSRSSSSNTFRTDFETLTGIEFTPTNFRRFRLKKIRESDALVMIRTSMSESGAFELSYNLHLDQPKPVFYAHWIGSPIKTTLLRELESDYSVRYCEFVDASDVIIPFRKFVEEFNLLSCST